MPRISFLLFILFVTLTGCAVNPVTGQRELALISESREIEMGRENYGPSRQIQGGDYSVEAGLTSYVDEIGQRLAAVSDRQLPYEFVVLNNSTPNAWALPGGKIAVNRGLLLELNNEAELAAVLAHEIVHAAARHGVKGFERGLFLQGALLTVGIASRGENYADYVVGGAQVAAQFIYGKYSRKAELEADYYGMHYMSRAGYDPRAAVELQKTFVRLMEDKSPNWLAGLFASHPPSQERVDANIRTAGELPGGGDLGLDRYRKRIANLRKLKDAYAAYDKGRKALAANNIQQALTSAGQALAAEPREALFHGLRGDVRLAQKRYQDALVNFDRAVKRNDDYFYFYLKRGLTRVELGESAKARTDLEASVRLLPTAMAYNALGNIALAKGRYARAREYFRSAAGSKSESGRQAFESLARLELPENPGKYLQGRIGRDGNGVFFAEIINSSPIPVRDVQVLISYVDTLGRAYELRKQAMGIIRSGGSLRLRLGVPRLKDQATVKSADVVVLAAQPAE